MRVHIILFCLFIPFILIRQNISRTYENDSIVFINKIDSTQNFKADSKFKIEVSFDEEYKLDRGQFLIQNLEYPDEVVIFTINKVLNAVDEEDIKEIVFEILFKNRVNPIPTQIILYKKEDSEFNMIIDAKEYMQTFKNLIVQQSSSLK